MTTTAVEAGLTRRLAETLAGFAASGVTDESLREAERAFVDTIGVALAATDDPTVVTLLAAVDDVVPGGPCRMLVDPRPARAAHAALVNGTAAHALDYDDVTYEVRGHPSAVLVPTALAVAEEQGSSGRAALLGYLAGYHAMCVLGAALDLPRHYSKGWHATATLGVVGAAATAAQLYGLDAGRTAHALAIAGSTASGSRRNFGTMTKPLHAGLAASRGVTAARLARAGFTADPTMLEAPLGYLDLYGDGAEPTATAEVPDLGHHRLSVKRYPACYNTHRAIDAVLDGPPVDLDAVESIRVTVEPSGLGPLIHARPRTGLEARFSLEYTVAAALADREASLATFTDEQCNRPAVQALLRRIEVVESPTPPVGPLEWALGYACVEILLRDGTVHARRADQPRGYGQNPLSDAELHAKFTDCAQFGTGHEQDDLLRALDSLRSVDDLRHLPDHRDAPTSRA